jgi:hypothetical protein
VIRFVNVAKEASPEADQDALELVHPVYLDTPMND